MAAKWVKDPYDPFGLYLPPSVKVVKYEDGYEYDVDGKAEISLQKADESTLPYLRKADDMSRYREYIGSEFWGDTKSIRYDYFLYDYEGNQTYIRIRYHNVKEIETVRPQVLAVAGTIRYSPLE